MSVGGVPVTAYNPHGTCDDCGWHTVHKETDISSTAFVWRCWRCSGSPETRLVTVANVAPPACECHYKSE